MMAINDEMIIPLKSMGTPYKSLQETCKFIGGGETRLREEKRGLRIEIRWKGNKGKEIKQMKGRETGGKGETESSGIIQKKVEKTNGGRNQVAGGKGVRRKDSPLL